MVNAGASIEAVLTLNNSGFTSGLDKSISSLESFATKVSKFSGNITTLESTLNSLNRILGDNIATLEGINSAVAGMKDFNSFATAINKTANALKILSDNTMNAEQGINIMNNIFKAWGDTLNGTEIKIKGIISSIEQINNPTKQADNTLKQMQTDLMNLQKGVEPMARVKEQSMAMRQEFERSRAELMQFAQYGVTAFNEVDAQSDKLKMQLSSMNAEFERSKAELLEFARYGRSQFETIVASEEKLNASVNQTTNSLQRQATATKSATTSTNAMTSSTNALSKALSSLKMVGTLVASMMVWNFASSLVNATRETVNAKSEMEGYFQMLGFGQANIDSFNEALDRTVSQFQRVNRYSLGETIASIGVEFNLTTQEMEKAMSVTAMLTSEYLRAGRNANEASLAVKDILQGQFQRLSRETGVKGEQLKEAGWSGDPNDTMGLLEALEKIAYSRNWDVFAQKANSLNDIVTILQNRFGEWSADMVYAVQPAIVGAFNTLMDVAGLLGNSLSGLWEFLNGDSWTASAIKVGAFVVSLNGLLSALVSVRTGASLLEISQMGLKNSIIATILGLDAETVATNGVTTAIASKITGLKAEELGEIGARNAIFAKVLGLDSETVAEEGLIVAINESIIAKKIEEETTIEQTGANIGFLSSLFSVIFGEELATDATLTLSGALGILTAEFLMSPIGEFAIAVTALAGAFYVLTGGLDEQWGLMKEYNETLQNSSTIVQENYNYLHQLGEQVGYDSEKYLDAKKSVEEFNVVLANSEYITERLNTELSTLGVHLDTLATENSDELGLSEDQIKQQSQMNNIMQRGNDIQYEALQIAEAQTGQYQELDKYILGSMSSRLDTSNEEDWNQILDKRTELQKHYDALIQHSAIHNTSDDWWEGTWNGLLAVIDRLQIDLDILSEKFAYFWYQITQWAENITWDDIFSIGDYLNIDKLFGTGLGDGTSIGDWVTNNIVKPFDDTLLKGIQNIPLGDYLLSLFGLVNGDNSGASQTGTDLGTAFKDRLEGIIKGIPILSDIYNLLSTIIQTYSDARSKGQGVGDAIKQGLKAGINGLASIVSTELQNVVDTVSSYVGKAYNSAKDVGGSLVRGVKDSMHMHSPSIISRELLPQEFGVNIPNAIASQIDTVYGVAQQYGQSIVDGMASTQGTGVGLDSMVGEYQTDAQTVSMYSQMMGTDTTTAFNDMNIAVNNTTSQMSDNVASSYTSMQQKQSSLLNNMKSSNTTAYNEMYTKSNQSLLQMRDSTSNITNQMIDAWSHMKTQLVATADALRSESTSHFNQLSNTIGSFYRKIQNPSNWGSAGSSSLRQGTPNRRVGRAVASTLKPSGYAGGNTGWKGSKTMTVASLKNKLCPNGECDTLFDGFNPSDTIDVEAFLMSIGMGHGFGWNGWNKKHYDYIKNKSDAWDMRSPIINLVGGIQTNSRFKVGDFENGSPHISFSSFQGMAESIFSAIPYKFYYDSSWKGSWLGALQSGACNCYDGASALIAFANTCGFSGSMAHGTWNGIPHVWAVINGRKMDTTGWQQRRTWTPSASAGSPRNVSIPQNEVHIHIDMSGSTNYGIDNIEDKIEEGVKKGLREQFNNPVTVRI